MANAEKDISDLKQSINRSESYYKNSDDGKQDINLLKLHLSRMNYDSAENDHMNLQQVMKEQFLLYELENKQLRKELESFDMEFFENLED